MTRAGQHCYEFALWPAEQGHWERPIFDVWRAGQLHRRIQMDMTEAEWSAFSSSLERQGITIRELEVDAPNAHAVVVDGVEWPFDYSDGKRHVCPCGRPYKAEPKEWCLTVPLHHQHGDRCCDDIEADE